MHGCGRLPPPSPSTVGRLPGGSNNSETLFLEDTLPTVERVWDCVDAGYGRLPTLGIGWWCVVGSRSPSPGEGWGGGSESTAGATRSPHPAPHHPALGSPDVIIIHAEPSCHTAEGRQRCQPGETDSSLGHWITSADPPGKPSTRNGPRPLCSWIATTRGSSAVLTIPVVMIIHRDARRCVKAEYPARR